MQTLDEVLGMCEYFGANLRMLGLLKQPNCFQLKLLQRFSCEFFEAMQLGFGDVSRMVMEVDNRSSIFYGKAVLFALYAVEIRYPAMGLLIVVGINGIFYGMQKMTRGVFICANFMKCDVGMTLIR